MQHGLFYLLLTQPIYNALVALYDVLPFKDMGLVIILVTVLIKLILWPFTGQSLKAQKAMRALQPKVEAVKEQYKEDKEAQAKAMMELYKEEKINPLSSCLPMLVQLPVLLALYRVLRVPLTDATLLSGLYTFVSMPEQIQNTFLGLIELSQRNIPLAVVAGVVQFVQVKMLQQQAPPKTLAKKEGAQDEAMMAQMTQTMTYTMPIITVIFGFTLPAGVMLYWLTSGLVSVLQQWLVFRTSEAK